MSTELRTSVKQQSKFTRLRNLVFPASVFSIADGLLKLWKHFFSIWRFGPLDYLVGSAAVFVGLLSIIMLVKPFKSSLVAIASFVFVTISIMKIVTDIQDPADVFLSLTAIALSFFVMWISSTRGITEDLRKAIKTWLF